MWRTLLGERGVHIGLHYEERKSYEGKRIS